MQRNQVRTILTPLAQGEIGTVTALQRMRDTFQPNNRSEDNKDTGICAPSVLLLQDKASLLAPLEALVGLREVKCLVDGMVAQVVVQRLRQEVQLHSNADVRHMIFTGRPGTGKTTVARVLGQLFSKLGVLSTGHVLEVERADLVGEYVGHTAQKTKAVLTQASGGVLFIDEAYSLARGGERDFGREAIDTLVKGMEEKRGDLIVILAGYPDEMQFFLSLNPGLYSRFPIHIEFPDFAEKELLHIATQMIQERDYRLTADAVVALRHALRRERELETFSNGRSVRNLIERAFRRHALRVAKLTAPTRADLMNLIATDFREESQDAGVFGHRSIGGR